MKSTYLISVLVALLIASNLNAQNSKLEKANRYFENTYYSEAIPLYEEFLEGEGHAEAGLNLADSYFYVFRIEEAANLYGKMIASHSAKMDERQIFNMFNV